MVKVSLPTDLLSLTIGADFDQSMEKYSPSHACFGGDKHRHLLVDKIVLVPKGSNAIGGNHVWHPFIAATLAATWTANTTANTTGGTTAGATTTEAATTLAATTTVNTTAHTTDGTAAGANTAEVAAIITSNTTPTAPPI